jgi:hypothetical protein
MACVRQLLPLACTSPARLDHSGCRMPPRLPLLQLARRQALQDALVALQRRNPLPVARDHSLEAGRLLLLLCLLHALFVPFIMHGLQQHAQAAHRAFAQRFWRRGRAAGSQRQSYRAPHLRLSGFHAKLRPLYAESCGLGLLEARQRGC